MSHYIILVLLLLGGGSALRAQTAPTVQWQRRVGARGANSPYENAWSVIHTRRNRVVALGYSQTGNNPLRTLWQLNGRGDSLRLVTYGTISRASYTEVTEASDGDLWLQGMYSYPSMGGQDGYREVALARTDSLGNLRWTRVLPYRLANTYAIQPVPDGGALLVVAQQHPLGTLTRPVKVPTVIRVDSLGNVVWAHTYGTPYSDLQAITPLADGSYALAGNYIIGSPPNWSGKGWLVRIAIQTGDTLRTRTWPDANFGYLAATPDGGLALGGVGLDAAGAVLGRLVQTDSLGRTLWQRDVPPLVPVTSGGDRAYVTYVRALAVPGHVLVGGYRNNVRPPYPAIGSHGYLAEFAPAGPGTAAPVWEQQYPAILDPKKVAEGPGPVLTVVGNYQDPVTRNMDLLFTRIGPLPAFYQVPYCQRPPAAYFAAAATGAAAVQVLDASTAGPRYAQLVSYRWAWGDGSASSGPAPGPHTYARPPLPGTAVTLTVTNNLGCTSTHTEYPFGPLSAAQASRVWSAGLHLAPNPSTGRVALALAGLGPQGPAALALLDGLGRTVLAATAPVTGGTLAADLDLGPLAPGLYLLRVTTREGTATRRLVRE